MKGFSVSLKYWARRKIFGKEDASVIVGCLLHEMLQSKETLIELQSVSVYSGTTCTLCLLVCVIYSGKFAVAISPKLYD